MKLRKDLLALSVATFMQAAFATTQIDTLDLMGGTAAGWGIGWYGEAWKNGKWCGDIVPDTAIDTIMTADTVKDTAVSSPVSDTVIQITQRDTLDPLLITTATLDSQIVVKDSVNDTVVDIIHKTETIIDSSMLQTCFETDYITDTGGLYPGASYIDFYYKFRKSWAQLPVVWSNWAGVDSLLVSPCKQLLIVYKGLLPDHRANLEFFYATWGSIADTMRNVLKLGDGVGTIPASPSEWTSAIVEIPDSVTLSSITGMVFGIGNVSSGDSTSDSTAGATSEIGNFKVARIALVCERIVSVKRGINRPSLRNNRHGFTPAGRSVSLTVYSLKGEALFTKNVTVQAGRQYAIGQFVRAHGGACAGQVRMARITGGGVDITTLIREGGCLPVK